MGAGIPEAFASLLRMQSAALSQQEKSPVSTRTQTGLASKEVPRAMRRLIGSRGSDASHEALVAASVAESLGCDNDEESREAYRKARKTGKWERTRRRGAREEQR